LLLREFLGFADLFYQRRNQSRKILSLDDLSCEEYKLIKYHNQADLQLYHYAQTQLNDLISQYLTVAEINRFSEANSQNHQWIR
jgi:hypothetical protein